MGAPVDDEMDIASSTWDTFEAMRCWAPCWIGSRSLAQETGMCLPPFSFFCCENEGFFSHTCTYAYIYNIHRLPMFKHVYIYIYATPLVIYLRTMHIFCASVSSLTFRIKCIKICCLFLFETYTAISIFWGMWISGKRNWTEIQTTLQRWSYFVQHESTSDQ